MDYEKKYKDALKKAKEVYNRKYATDGGKLILESIFPELKESEDERIRKEIIEALKQLDREKCPVDTYPYLDWAAWLEKQDEQIEQKPINECNTHEPTIDEARKWNEAYEKGYSLGYENGKNEQKPTERSLPYEKNETAEKLIALAECLEMDGDCLFNGLSGYDYGKLLRVLAIDMKSM